MPVHIIAVTPAANVMAANAVLEALGYGPDNFSTKASTAENPAWDDPPAHYYFCWQFTPAGLADTFLAFAGGSLPPTTGEWGWGEYGVISEEDALAAVTPANFAFAIFNDGLSALQQVDVTLAAYDPPLHKIPDPPL